MNDDELFRNLRDAHLAQEAADRPNKAWEDLTLGEADPAVHRDLKERAATDEGAKEALALHEPLDTAARDRIVGAILATEPPAAKHEDKPPETGRVLAFRPRAWWAVVPALAAAAALVLFLQHPGGSALPTYQQSWTSQVREARSPAPIDEREPVTLHTAAQFEWVARPAIPASGPVVARAAIRQGDSTKVWSVPVEVSEQSSIRIHGAVADLFPPQGGEFEVVLVIARGESISDDTLLRWAKGGDVPDGESGLRVLKRRVRVLPAGE